MLQPLFTFTGTDCEKGLGLSNTTRVVAINISSGGVIAITNGVRARWRWSTLNRKTGTTSKERNCSDREGGLFHEIATCDSIRGLV